MSIVGLIYNNSYASENIRRFFQFLKLYYPYNLMYMNRVRNAQPQIMKDAQAFFSGNKDRVNKICSYLADEQSVDTYIKLIKLRQFYKKEDIPKYCYFDQYFPKDLPDFSEKWNGGEIAIDCGAFSGDVTSTIAKKIANYSHIYAFEPDRNNISSLKKRMARLSNVSVIEKACSDKEGTLYFQEEKQSGSSHVANENNSEKVGFEVPCTTIDSVIGSGRVDYIKMDIEGAEWDALHGAAKVIKENKPKLAISIYHSDEDMIRLVEYIHSLVPEYKLFIRAHTMGIAETILYAMV